MKKLYYFMICALAANLLGACDKPKKNEIDNILVPPRVVNDTDTIIHKMNETSSRDTVKWVGSTYQISVHRHTSDSLTMIVDNNGRKYRNNIIDVVIRKANGSVFFDKKFTKAMFEGKLDKAYYEQSVLLGLVFNGSDKNSLSFLGSVGSPDILSEEFVPFDVTISEKGEVNIKKANLKTEENDSTLLEEDGV